MTAPAPMIAFHPSAQPLPASRAYQPVVIVSDGTRRAVFPAGRAWADEDAALATAYDFLDRRAPAITAAFLEGRA